MRAAFFGLALTILALGFAATAAGDPSTSSAIPGCTKDSLNLLNAGQLSLATDNPAFNPWWAGGSKSKDCELNDPSTGKGYESAVAYAVAKQLGFTKGQVDWVQVPFAQSYRPGDKDFDFYMAQVSCTPERDKVVDLSNSYYFVNQSVVARKGTPITSAKSVAALKPYRFGAQLGTTSYQYIQKYIQPDERPLAYKSNDLAVQALKNGRLDGIVVDLPTAFYVTAVQVEDGVIVGQLPNRGSKERFGMVFEQGNPLRGCVNKALNKLWANGTIKKLQNVWVGRRPKPCI